MRLLCTRENISKAAISVELRVTSLTLLWTKPARKTQGVFVLRVSGSLALFTS